MSGAVFAKLNCSIFRDRLVDHPPKKDPHTELLMPTRLAGALNVFRLEFTCEDVQHSTQIASEIFQTRRQLPLRARRMRRVCFLLT